MCFAHTLSGIRGLSDADKCSLRPSDALNSLNLISGFVFLSGLLVTILAIIYLFCKDDPYRKRVITGVGIGLIAVNIVIGFYVALHILPNVAIWKKNKILCNEAVYRSSFGVIAAYFLMVSIIMTISAVIFSCWVLKKIRNTVNDLRLEILAPLSSFFQ